MENKINETHRISLFNPIELEYSYGCNFLGVINNTMDKEFEMKVCYEPETIKISDCNPKKQTCVLTNHGIVTDVIKFD